MDSMKGKDGRKRAEFDSAVEGLIRELKENVAASLKDPHPFLGKIRSLGLELQRGFFRRLLDEADESILLWLEILARKDEGLGLTLVEIIGQCGSPRNGELLQRMSSAKPSKEMSKAIRRSVFRLKSRGIALDLADERPPAVFHLPEPASAEGFVGPVDVQGERIVWLARPQIPKGIVAFTAHLSFGEGIIEFSGVETSRKNFREYLFSISREYSEGIVEADSGYCHRLIAEALEWSQSKGKPPSAETMKWQPFLGPPPPPQKPLIYRFLSPEEAKSHPDLMASAATLWETPLFRNWFLKKEECQKYIDLLQEASGSRLVLAPYQKENRIMEIYRQAMRELFDSRRRQVLSRALEENAYILWKKEKTPEARLCLALTGGLTDETGILSSHPFLEGLVKRSLHVFMEEPQEKQKEDYPLLIRP